MGVALHPDFIWPAYSLCAAARAGRQRAKQRARRRTAELLEEEGQREAPAEQFYYVPFVSMSQLSAIDETINLQHNKLA
jgi:hypothetical protein